MKSIYTYGGKSAQRNLTVAELRAAKGKKRFSQVTVSPAEEAAAAEETAGIDIISTVCPLTADMRKGAKARFLHSATMLTDYRTEDEADKRLDAAASASHRDAETNEFLSEHRIRNAVSTGSSLQFCLVVSGDADVYPHFDPTMGWDRANDDAIVRAAGGSVTSPNGMTLGHGKRDYRNGAVIAWGDRL